MNALPLGRSLFVGLSLVAVFAIACDDGPDAAPGAGTGGSAGSTTGASGNTQGGTTGSGYTAASVPSLDAFVAAYAPADCAAKQPCCADAGAQARTDCTTRLTTGINEELSTEDLPPGVAYSPEGGAACLNAIAAMACSSTNSRGGDACQDVFRSPAYRTRVAGETCVVDGDCVEAAGTHAQCEDVCVVYPIAATGAACDEVTPASTPTSARAACA